MEIKIPIDQEFSLLIVDKPDEATEYPTSRIQKGFVISKAGINLAEEAVGFGLPVLKRGLETFFPRYLELELLQADLSWVIHASYTINLVRVIMPSGTAHNSEKIFYAVQNILAAIIRRTPIIRNALTAISSTLLERFGLNTTFETADFNANVQVTYTFDEQNKTLEIETDLSRLPPSGIDEAIVMNEQGAHFFDQYRDSSGVSISGKEIGIWDEVTAEEATFASSSHRIAFSLHRMPGARLYRGRELIGSRLAWAGFGYSFPPTTRKFSYTVKIETLP
jgi:hypothetical protein